MPETYVNLVYLIAATFFVLGLKGLSHPKTAPRGNLMASLGMFIAVVVTLLDRDIVGYQVIIIGLIVGSIIGGTLAVKIAMTAMPQLVALFNGFGGGASVLVAGAVFVGVSPQAGSDLDLIIATAASGIIGSVTFWGSLVAFGKLQGLITEKPVLFLGRYFVLGIFFITTIALSVFWGINPESVNIYWAIVVLASIIGLLLVLPIGGADMPVVISLLNSYSGLAAASTGFVLENNVLIIAGSLVGAAGLILTNLMCKAMNRSLPNILFGGLGSVSSEASGDDDIYSGRVKSASAEEVATLLNTAQKVIIVPGYGMAVAQAQHAVRDLTNFLETLGIEIKFAIHPVAGRMPGHMNVLLAEADISYDKLCEMDQINPEFRETDVVLVMGANDVVNPMARDGDSSIPISGMPILDVDQAGVVIVIKRSLSHGFAAIPNPLFTNDNTLMLFGDAKDMTTNLVSSLKSV